MVVSTFNIEQLDSVNASGSVSDTLMVVTGSSTTKDAAFSTSAKTIQGHLPAVSNPTPASGREGIVTGDDSQWSDSPSFQPLLLYRYRFGWGRDDRLLTGGAFGNQYGKLTNYHGVIISQKKFSTQSTVAASSIAHFGSAHQKQFVTGRSGALASVHSDGAQAASVVVEDFPFVVNAIPAPFSSKNPIDTDVFIRLANFSFPTSSGTISLYLDGVQKPNINITEFFGGAGGFDITWDNNSIFSYDSTVIVKVVFSDTAVPSNTTIVQYPFYTVTDSAGPRLQNPVPADQSIGVSVKGPIQFDVVDFEQDVDINSLRLYVNNVLVSPSTGTLTVTRLVSLQGYTVSYVPNDPWFYGDLIPVAIFISDASKSKNERFINYSFTVAGSVSPRFVSAAPFECNLQVPTKTSIRFSIVDGGHGLEEKEPIVAVDGEGVSILIEPIIFRDD